MKVKTRRTFPAPPAAPRALVISAHPFADGFNHALALAWAEAARAAGLLTDVVRVADLDFDPVLHQAYRADQPLEPDLQRLQAHIAEAAHIVVAYPLWWGSTPAALKGLFDRVLQVGWAFKYDEKGLPVGGLAGRSARQIVTMGAPTWYDRLKNGASARRQVKNATLRFCGLKPVRTSAFGGVDSADEAKRATMLDAIREAGTKDAAQVRARFPAALPVPENASA